MIEEGTGMRLLPILRFMLPGLEGALMRMTLGKPLKDMVELFQLTSSTMGVTPLWCLKIQDMPKKLVKE